MDTYKNMIEEMYLRGKKEWKEKSLIARDAEMKKGEINIEGKTEK